MRLPGILRRSLRALESRYRGLDQHRDAGIAAYASRDFKRAAKEFTQALRGRTDRDLWLHAASTQERRRNLELRDTYVTVANTLFPVRAYDAKAAFAFSNARPHERDEVARWLASTMPSIRARAEELVSEADTSPRYAFVYWNSPDQPDVVQHCIDAMRRNLPAGLTLVVLNETTLTDWVSIDPAIMGKVDIPAHAADMIRLHLLSKYGGLWLDSSCLINEGFPAYSEQIRAEDFFLFTYSGSRTGNWFIWADAHSYRLQLLRAALDTWFLSGRGWTNYFMFHDVVEMLYWTDPRYASEWDAGLHLHPRDFFHVHRALGRPVTDEEWAAVRHEYPVNKLSWRKYNAPELRADPTTGIARFIAEPLAASTD